MKNNFFKILWILTLCAIIILIFTRLFAIDKYTVQGTSMEPFIKDGQTVYCNKLYYGLVKPFGDELLIQWRKPEINDIVIYLYENRVIVKRCAAIEGQKLEYSCDSQYNLYVDEKCFPLTETQYHLMFKSSQVPQDTILCIGDNAANSIDSRNYGFVPVKNVIGRIICK